MHTLKAIAVFFVINGIKMSNGEVFSSITSMESLLETQRKLINDTDLYILLEEKRLNLLKQQLAIYKKDNEKAMLDVPKYLGNPINLFTLAKRLTVDREFFHKSIEEGREHLKYNLTKSEATKGDLIGALTGLLRLKKTYKLEIKDLTEKKLNGIENSSHMLPSDCYVLGLALFNNGEFKEALIWFIEALSKFQNGHVDIMAFDEVEFLEYVGFTYYALGDEAGLKWTRELLDKYPNHERANHNLHYYEKVIADIKSRNTNELTVEERLYQEEAKLCRGEFEVSIQVTSKLKCRYLTENHPFLILAPFKLEELYKDPDIYMYHDVLSDHEIEHLQEMAKPHLERSKIRSYEFAEFRTSKTAWLKDEGSELVAQVSQRVKHMTTLDITSAEDLQVANYGIGGHYESHYDFLMNMDEFSGNRIATVLFYMSDVPSGGATAFIDLGLRVTPKKGTALFWMNLHPSGEGDLATRHAACPVIIGSKWICTKWINQEGQELMKPCNLQYQPLGINRNLPDPVPITTR